MVLEQWSDITEECTYRWTGVSQYPRFFFKKRRDNEQTIVPKIQNIEISEFLQFG